MWEKMNNYKSNDLISKSRMLRKLVKYYPRSEQNYLYSDFYKLTNYTIELLLKEKWEVNK